MSYLYFFLLEFLDLWALLRYGSFRECCWWSLLCLYKVIQWWSVVQLQWSTCQQGKEGFFEIIILKDEQGRFYQSLGLLKWETGCVQWSILRYIPNQSFVFALSKFPALLIVVISWFCFLWGLLSVSRDRFPIFLLSWAFMWAVCEH